MQCAFAAPAAVSILVFGDSLSAAYGLSQHEGWVTLLEKQLRTEHPDYNVANASISGETTGGGLARLPGVLARQRPQVLVLALGANDGLRGLPVGQMKQNLSAMVELARKAKARVLLVGIRMPPNYGPEYTAAFEAAFASVAKQHNVAFLPSLLGGIGEKPEYFQPDRLHPTAQAQPLILENVRRALLPLLKASAPKR